MTDTKLPNIPIESIEDLETLFIAVEALRDNLERRMQILLDGSSIVTLDLTASVGYTASELQEVSDKVDTIIAALRTAGIISEE